MKVIYYNGADNGICGHFAVSLSNLCVGWENILKEADTEDDVEIILNSCYFDGHAFDYVFEQNRKIREQQKVITLEETHRSPILLQPIYIHFAQRKIHRNDVFEQLPHLKTILSKLSFQDEVENDFSSFIENNKIGKNSLGVHIRITDMNHVHPEHGVHHFDDYVKIIDQIHHSYDNIFVASDNIESIQKMKDLYPDKVVYFDDTVHVESTETANHLIKVVQQWKQHGDPWNQRSSPWTREDPRAWQEIFREVMVLSRCGFLLGRSSSVSLCAILFSDDFNLCSKYRLVGS